MKRIAWMFACTCMVGSLALSAACDDDETSAVPGGGTTTFDPTTPGGNGGDNSGGSPATDAGARPADDGGLRDDADVVHVVLTANTGEVTHGTIAQAKAVSTDVKSFATMMVTEHGAAKERATALAQTLGVNAKANAVSAQLESEATTMTVQLQGASAADFDRLYIDSQITVHTKVLGLIESTLLPTASSPALRNELTVMRASVAMHLEHARELRTKLDTRDGGAGDAATDADASDVR